MKLKLQPRILESMVQGKLETVNSVAEDIEKNVIVRTYMGRL